jgi:predicted dehydrogenase/D-arabinose 1-dehydrogenase-like Zn-dependent alcohol dehydrogenase
MRHEFLNPHIKKIKKFLQPLLDDNQLLVAIHYLYQWQKNNSFSKKQLPYQIKIAQKVRQAFTFEAARKTTLDRSMEKKENPLFSFSGQVLAIGPQVKHIRPGDFVASTCAQQASTNDTICVNEEEVIQLTNIINIQETAFVAFALKALQIIQQSNLQLGQHVCIFGNDLFAQLVAQLAHLHGCNVTLLSNNTKTQITIDDITQVDTQQSSWQQDILNKTYHYGIDTMIITQSIHDQMITLDNLYSVLHEFATIVITHPIDLTYKHHSESWKKNVIVKLISESISSNNATQTRDVQTILNLINEKKIVCHDAMNVQQFTHPDFLPQIEQSEKLESPLLTILPFKHRQHITMGIVGGHCSTARLIAQQFAKQNTTLHYAKTNAHILPFSLKQYENSIQKEHSHHTTFLDDSEINAVLIASNHQSHTSHTIRALSQAKAVLTCNPLIANKQDLEELKNLFNQYPDAPLCVGYFRSFSLYAQKIKTLLQKRSTPVMMHHRINMSVDSKDYEIISQEKSGHILAHMCHFLDFSYYLIDTQPVSVSVESSRAIHETIFPTSNFTAQIAFDDGSICSLLYNTIGHKDAGHERTEIFFDNKTITMENGTLLSGYGLSASFNQVMTKPDDGSATLVKQFLAACANKNTPWPISQKRILIVCKLALIIDNLACHAGGQETL